VEVGHESEVMEKERESGKILDLFPCMGVN
jgi:hypothetical protein